MRPARDAIERIARWVLEKEAGCASRLVVSPTLAPLVRAAPCGRSLRLQRMAITLDHLRRYAVARSLFKPTTLARAIERLGFVQADPIRAPARAQDLTLRHRVVGYRAGDLERHYPKLPLEEDFFVNYGFLPRAHPDASAHAARGLDAGALEAGVRGARF